MRVVRAAVSLPNWVPIEASQYLAHRRKWPVFAGIAQADGLAPSTICRRVRRMEARRDDPLVDEALDALALTRRRRQPKRPTNRSHRHDRAVSIPDCFR
jgi:hypothetical protein